MSERKVLTKYYPPDFDPSELGRRRGPKQTGPKVQAVRLMAPMSMKCTTCGEYIYKGRKFNSRKITPPDERYLGIQIYFFSIKCTRCSAEITFRTDPARNDYAMVKGAVRNFEPWRNLEAEQETVEQRLDRLEREEAEAAGEADEERDAMADLEAKNADARAEMAAADALDEIQQRNARIRRSEKEGVDFADYIVRPEDEQREQQEREDEEAARRAFAAARQRMLGEEEIIEEVVEEQDAPGPSSSNAAGSSSSAVAASSASSSDDGAGGGKSDVNSMPPPPPVPTFRRAPKKKVDYAAKLGIKKKTPLV